VPGRNCETNFKQMSKTRWIMELDNSVSISEVVVFKLPNTQAMPNGSVMGVYLSDQSKNFEYLGAISNSKQSLISHVPQSFENVQKQVVNQWGSIHTVDDNKTKVLYLGLSLEEESTMKSMQPIESRVNQTTSSTLTQMAKYLANDLFHFMESFVKPVKQHGSTMEVLVLPMNVLDQWIKKTNNKTSANPFFWKQ
jgi:hypothetical protein